MIFSDEIWSEFGERLKSEEWIASRICCWFNDIESEPMQIISFDIFPQ